MDLKIKKDIGEEIIETLKKLKIYIKQLENKIKNLEVERNDRNELAHSSIDENKTLQKA